MAKRHIYSNAEHRYTKEKGRKMHNIYLEVAYNLGITHRNTDINKYPDYHNTHTHTHIYIYIYIYITK
jgi:hypothetical protein